MESRVDKTSKKEEVGGKEDDITVIVAQVSVEEELESTLLYDIKNR